MTANGDIPYSGKWIRYISQNKPTVIFSGVSVEFLYSFHWVGVTKPIRPVPLFS